MEHLDTSNPESLVYKNQILRTTALGGIKLEGLDRMRVTLKVELLDSAVPPVRHNLDLYNDNQTEKLVRKVAERLEIGTSVVSASLSELTQKLEQYRLDRLAEQQQNVYKPEPLSDEELEEATTFLSESNLLERTNLLIGKSGVIGEEVNRLLMYLVFTSRKQQQPLHVISLGSSGAGKTHLQEKVGELVPEEDKIEITTLSENAFYYFGQQELKHKLILIEDLDGADNVLYPLRELQSKKRINKTIARKDKQGATKTVRLTVEGPVSVAGCTTKEQVYEDNANRSFLLYLDESKAQDKRIMDYQRRAAAGKVDKQTELEAAQTLRNAQKVLEPIKVVNPYAEKLVLPEKVFKPRRTNSHYLQFIEAVTFYHQAQREHKVDKTTGELFIETTIEDIKAANELLSETLLRKSDTLTGACRNYLEQLKSHLLAHKETAFTNRAISMALRISLPTVKRHNLQLFNTGYLSLEKDPATKAHHYAIVSFSEQEDRKAALTNLLDNVLAQLNGSVSAQRGIEPPNKQKNNKVNSTAHKVAKRQEA